MIINKNEIKMGKTINESQTIRLEYAVQNSILKDILDILFIYLLFQNKTN